MQPRRLIAPLLVMIPLMVPSPPAALGAASRTMWTGPGGVTVYAAPSWSAPALALLPDNQPIRVTGNGAWGRTLLWNALPAWVPLSGDGVLARPFPRQIIHVPPPTLIPVGPHAPLSLVARGRLREAVYLRAAPAFSATHLALLHAGTVCAINAWATDRGGAAWYRVVGIPDAGWVYGDAVTFDAGHPAHPDALLAPLRGKGMWLTYPLLQHSPVSAIVAAARFAGLSHLYVEVARSNEGFYGGAGLAALLPAAHRAGLKVIAWVYPFLTDLPADIAMSVAAARYLAPSGDRPDGLLADIEENMDEGAVRAYGQVLRAKLGADETMAVATYPPQWASGHTYPFATVALSWNVIVPMDYWHVRRRAYSAADAYTFIDDSVRLIRARTRPDEPVEVLGQMFDPFESGVNNPSAAEIAACARAARDDGTVGVSFFEWNHATQEEWGALAKLPPMGALRYAAPVLLHNRALRRSNRTHRQSRLEIERS